MSSDVHVFGDSHWRVFFPFVNHGSPGVTHEQDGVRTIDMVANELSGTTMYGLLNPNSRHHGRSRILGDLDRIGPVDNVGLVFGEVDARYHNGRYFEGGVLCSGRVLELVSRYVKFVQEDLILSGRVRENVFIYHGFAYPKGEQTLLQPGHPIGGNCLMAEAVNHLVGQFLGPAFMDIPMVKTIVPAHSVESIVSSDGVHLEPERVYSLYTLPAMRDRLAPLGELL